MLTLHGPALADPAKKIAAMAPSALVLIMDDDGNELVVQNVDKSFVPASVVKIVTAWLAMEELGADYRFETGFYLDEERVLYVRGAGDPFLVSEELALIATRLVAAVGKDAFTGMVVDNSYYPQDLQIPGIEYDAEAYNAPNSALAANFNTIHAVRSGKTVRSAEKQTPITPLAISQFQARGPNGRGRISLAQEDPSLSARYAGELLAAFLDQIGSGVDGDISLGAIPEGLEPIYLHHQSRSLSEILRLMLLGSNNFIANQIFLEIGVQRLGRPVSLQKSLQVARAILAEHGIVGAIHLEEGSGISRDNRFTARGLATVLNEFSPHADLLRRTDAGSRYKTGTLPSASTLAGYAKTADHGQVRFVIALPGGTGNLRFQLLREIEREF